MTKIRNQVGDVFDNFSFVNESNLQTTGSSVGEQSSQYKRKNSFDLDPAEETKEQSGGGSQV